MLSPIKQLRQKHGFSQQDLAKLAMKSQGHISDIERGFVDLDQSLLNVFRNAGEDVEKLKEKHLRFMRAAQRELKSKLRQTAVAGKD